MRVASIVAISYGVTEFQRGDVVQFLLNPKMSNQKYVLAGDTIGWIVSNEEQRNLIQLKGELNIMKAEMVPTLQLDIKRMQEKE